MTTPIDNQIESILRDMTAESKDKPRLWQIALRSVSRKSTRNALQRSILKLANRPLATAASLIIATSVTIAAIAFAIPSLSGRSARATRAEVRAQVSSLTVDESGFRYDAGGLVGRDQLTLRSPLQPYYDTNVDGVSDLWGAIRSSDTTPTQFVCPSMGNFYADAKDEVAYKSDLRGLGEEMRIYSADAIRESLIANDENSDKTGPADRWLANGAASQAPARNDASAGRQVIRRATIELKTSDVRGAFLKVQQLLEVGHGEYIENSGIHGADDRMTANLTLRVAAIRLSDVLNQLRELGEVVNENMIGEDVTMRVVDIEARLRNERQVEAEVLQLLETRKDAPLEEILKLRQSLATIRTNIEQMTGQREQLARLVSLSTILVLIRAGDPPPAESPSLWNDFVNALSKAWRNGVGFLGAAVATIISVLIGGLVFWIAIIATLFAVRRRLRNKAQN